MIHNQLSYGAELQNGIASAVGLDRNQDGVVRLGETLDPTIDPWSQPEWAFLRGERLGSIQLFVNQVAAEFSMITLGNAIDSKSIVVVEAVQANVVAGTTMNLEVVADSVIAATLSGQAFAVSGRDRRFGSTTGRVFVRSGTDPGSTFGVRIDRRSSTADVYVDFKMGLPCILKPGDNLLVICATVNITIEAGFKWRERKAFTGELTP